MAKRLIRDYYLSIADTACWVFLNYYSCSTYAINRSPANALNKIQFITIIKTPTCFTPVAILRDKYCGIKSSVEWNILNVKTTSSPEVSTSVYH